MVVAGSEIIAIKPSGKEQKVYRKTVRCNMCGLCCENIGKDWLFGTKELEMQGKVRTVCAKVFEDGKSGRFECLGGPKTPWGCFAECTHAPPHPECIIEYEEA